MDFSFIKKEKFLLCVLLFISFFMYFHNLGAPSLFETDEVIYNQVAREIVRTGDWMTMHLYGKNWFIHPPLYMWLTAASSYVFGINEFNVRLWNALMAVGLVFVTYLLGKKLYKDGVGLLGAFILATTMQYIVQAHLAIFDIPYVLFMFLGILSLFYSIEDKLYRYYYLAFLFFGLSMLMKGPVGLLLPFLIFTPYLFMTKNLKALYNLNLIPAAAIAVCVGGGWYIAEYIIHGKAFYDSVVAFYLVGRFTTTIEAHYGPMYFYVFVVLIGFLPWTPFLFGSFYYQAKKTGDSANLFSVMWMAIVFLFFSAAQTKLPGYIMSFYPIAALSIAKMLSDHMSGEDRSFDTVSAKAFKVLLIFSVVIIIVAALFKVFDAPEGLEKLFFDLNIMFFVIGAGSLAAALTFFHTKDVIKPIVILVSTMVVFGWFTATFTLVDIDDFKPMRAMSYRINSEHMDGQTIVGYNVLYRGSFQHYLDKPVVWENDIIRLRQLVNNAGDVYIISSSKDFPEIGQEFKKPTYLLMKQGDLVLLFKKK
jgi:4-amino-4-deoxy-L-arabinose transferase-like glycosyltransferase